MKRTAYIARTADNKAPVNRLRYPAFGIRHLHLKAGTKASKCHLPSWMPPPDKNPGTDDFHFVPEKETFQLIFELSDPFGRIQKGKLELFGRFEKDPLWTLDLSKLGADWWAHGKHTVTWDGRIVSPKAEQKGTKKPDGLEHDLTALNPDPNANKEAFPDGYVTLEHPPYKLKLTVGVDDEYKECAVAWTYFHILIKSIELVLGPEETVPAAAVNDDRHKRDKAVRKKIADDGGLPADGATRKVFLISNLYKTASAQMNDNTGFDVYKTLWGDGPNIPILAKIRLADSNDAEVKLDESDKGAVALGKAKFLWDWEDVDEDVDGQQGQAKPKAFIKNAITYYKDGTDAARAAEDHTYPKGDNCHVDRGGKRGPGAKAVFPEQAGYDPKDALDVGKFPFKVVAGSGSADTRPKKRKWASYSQGWTKGKLKGQTGVVFQPSRMAGDNYKVAVYLSYDKKLDTADNKVKEVVDVQDEPLKVPDAVKKKTGVFQVWREIHLARYIRKKSTIGAFLPANLANVQGLYDEAYVHVEDEMEADDQYTVSDHKKAGGGALDYNTLCKNRLAGSGNVLYTKELAVEQGADHASVDSAFLSRSYGDFVVKVHEHLDPAGTTDFTDEGIAPENLDGTALPAVNPAWSAARQARITRLGATQLQLRNSGLETKKKYAAKLDDQLCTIIETQLASDLQLISGGKDGVNTAAKEGITIIHFNYTHTYLRDLIAGDPSVGAILGSAIDPSDSSRTKCAFLYLVPRLDTFVHEIGHHLFMPHAPTAGGFIRDRHDELDGNCMMSYNRPRLSFCGLCQLRLRGWSATALSKTSADNKKP